MESLDEHYRAVVIGAAGGLGRAFVARLRDDPRCGDVIALARASRPALDLTDEASVAAAAAHVHEKVGAVHLVIDSTGVLTIDGQGPEKSIARLDPAVMARAFAINATGPALLLKHFTPLLPRRGRSIFATLSARVGSIADNRKGGWISYRASKAALNQIVRTTAIEMSFRRREAVLAALQPGTVRTALSEPYAGASDRLEPEESARRLLCVLDGLGSADSGGLFDHRGQRLPW